MSGTFIVYGVARKLARAEAHKVVADEYERYQKCMNVDKDAPEKIARKAVELYGSMKPAAISPWLACLGLPCPLL